MRTTLCCLVILLTALRAASAQEHNDLQIRLGTFTTKPDGGEKPAGGWFIARVTIGKPVVGFFSFGETCEAWSISSRPSITADTTAAWKIETTPIRVEGDAVTFRLRWVRMAGLKQQIGDLLRALEQRDAKATGKLAEALAAEESRLPGEDLDLTLRPGESYPVDSVKIPTGAKNVHGRLCGPSDSIRVSVDAYPGADDERRLVSADLWLIERLADGTEAQRSQPLNVRGLPNRPFRFYFDSLVDGKATLDVYGILIAKPGSNAMAVNVETRSRWAPETRNIGGPQQFFTSKVQLAPAETVEIRLPAIDEGPFAKRLLSIRIRARQLR